MAIAYSDGFDIEARILRLVDQEEDLRSDSAPASRLYHEWPVRYHLSPERSNLLRHLDFHGLNVLELGAGMGGVSRYLAEVSGHLTVVEGTSARYKVLASRLRNLSNWSGMVADVQDSAIRGQFDVVCVIGVLEYSDLYIKSDDADAWGPARAFLRKASSLLRDGGVLVLAIENRLGIKYWSGAAEDHTGLMFDGVCGYPLRKSPRTFSRRELLGLLGDVGFSEVEEHLPFPDYKVPSSVITSRLATSVPDLTVDLACGERFENYGQPRVRAFPDLLALRGIAQAGLFSEFANSFLFVASRTGQSTIYRQLLRRQLEEGEVGWHYSRLRRVPTRTVFHIPRNSTGMRVEKRALRPADPDTHLFQGTTFGLRWRALESSEIRTGQRLRYRLCNAAYFNDWATVQSVVKTFIEWSFERWHVPGSDALQGEAFDAILKNAASHTDNAGGHRFELFDLEWVLTSPFSRTWFVLRNLYTLTVDSEFSGAHAPFGSTEEWYGQLCRELGLAPQLDADVAREAEVHALVSSRGLPPLPDDLRNFLRAPFGSRGFPRIPREELERRPGRTSFLSDRPPQLLRLLRSGLRRVPLVHGVGRRILGTLPSPAPETR